jgi:hypothetical protein
VKAVFTLLLFYFSFAAPTVAQDQSAIASAQSACGPKETSFDAKEDTTQHPTPQPDHDKALVYVIQDFGVVQCEGCALTRVGMDGAWIGANQGSSYFFFTANPGEHHLCANWQSRLEWRNKAFAMANFTAEAGQAYYFRIRILATRSIYYFDLEPINSDQGKFLVASLPFSVSHPKK